MAETDGWDRRPKWRSGHAPAERCIPTYSKDGLSSYSWVSRPPARGHVPWPSFPFPSDGGQTNGRTSQRLPLTSWPDVANIETALAGKKKGYLPVPISRCDVSTWRWSRHIGIDYLSQSIIVSVSVFLQRVFLTAPNSILLEVLQ